MTSLRDAVARLMTRSKQDIPHYYLTMRPDISAALDRREEWNMAHAKEDRVSVNDLIVKAAALALAEHSRFNAYYRDGALHMQETINIGIAIALDDGLLAPALVDCREWPLPEIGRRSRDVAARAKSGTLRPEEYGTATFTVSNLGMFGVDAFLAIVTPPQVGILAVGAVRESPATREGEIITERQLALTLSADHRASNGAEGARFLGEIVSCLQNPERLFA